VSARDRDPLWSWSPVTLVGGLVRVGSAHQVACAPVVERSAAGAKRLGDVYWNEIDRSMHGVR